MGWSMFGKKRERMAEVRNAGGRSSSSWPGRASSRESLSFGDTSRGHAGFVAHSLSREGVK